MPSASTTLKCVVSCDSYVGAAGTFGGSGMNPSGRFSVAEGVDFAGSMVLRHAAVYAGSAICLSGMVLKSGSPR